MKRKIGFVHTSPAAIAPLMQFYGAQAPEMEITNLLDDGLLRFLAAGDSAAAERRFGDMLRVARDVYGAEAAMVTCSAVPAAVLESLRAGAGMPVLKIDAPMARRAVEAGRRIGVAVTFAPTVEPTRRLLLAAAEARGREVELDVEVVPGAYDALLGGDPERHDALLLAGIGRLAASGADVIVLAQVSMARVLERARATVAPPVISSLETSLAALREAIGHGS